MSVEFVDTSILIYAHDGGAGEKHTISITLLERLFEQGSGALSVQVLSEFFSAATRKLLMPSEEAESVLQDLAGWTIHSPEHADLIRAAQLHRRHRISWWDALLLNSAQQLSCGVLWSEDFNDGQRCGKLTIRNPFRD